MPLIIRAVIGAVLGAAVGFAIYKFIGCRMGACPLSGNPYIAMLLWGFLGVMVALGR